MNTTTQNTFDAISQKFADARMTELKIRAAALAACDAVVDQSGDPCSLAEIAAEYADKLGDELDDLEETIRAFMIEKGIIPA